MICNGELRLVIPTKEYEEQVMRYRKIFLEQNEPFDGCAGLEECESYEEWVDFEKRLMKKYKESYTPSTVYLAVRISDNKLVGIIDFRHKLTDFLFNYGGNIGYSVLPEERRKDYAKEMLKLMLEHCKEEGIHRILITCDKKNIGSYKTIIANGGVLENEVEDKVGLSKSGVIQRYWVYLKKRFASDIDTIPIVDKTERKIMTFDDVNFKGAIVLNIFKEMNKPLIVEDIEKCIADTNYKWLEFYDYNSKIKLTAMYDENNDIFEWYFDIARKIGKENNMPYEDDLYLDVVVLPNGEIFLLDEDELEDALERGEITKREYNEAYEVANILMKRLENKTSELREFTDKYFDKLIGDGNLCQN